MLINYSLQITHNYTDITLSNVLCNLSQKSDTIQVTNCLFDLKAPYNPSGYLLNAEMNSVSILNTWTTNSIFLETQWYLVMVKDVSTLKITSMKMFANYQFQGMFVYNPSSLKVIGFNCGDLLSTNFDTMKASMKATGTY